MPNFTEGLEALPFLDEGCIPVAEITTDHAMLRFHLFGSYTEFRVRTMFTKEHETIRWISSLPEGDVLWDIGANIGVYSVFAASRGLQVLAFEPSPTNSWLLNLNAATNFPDRITCLPIALSQSTELVGFEVDLSPAAAGVNQVRAEASRLVVQGYSIDALVDSAFIHPPQHLKIDVDGIELGILEGGRITLGSGRVSSVMCEVDERDSEVMTAIHDLLKSCGFSTVTTRHAPYFEENYYLPSANHLFTRG